MKIWKRTSKYVFEIAGCGSIGPYGYYTPYRVWRRVWYLPFIYKLLGHINLTTNATKKDIDEWIEWKENKEAK